MSTKHQNASNEVTPLLSLSVVNRRMSRLQQQDEASSYVASQVTKEEQALSGSTVGERLPYNDYTTIDWLHDLVCSGLFPLDSLCSHRKGQRLLPVQAGP